MLQVLARQEVKGLPEYRFLADGKDIRYVTVPVASDCYSEKELVNMLRPIWPVGNWHRAVLCECDECGWELEFKSITWFGSAAAPTVDGFLRQVVDYSDLTIIIKTHRNMQVVTHPRFPGRPLTFKLNAFPRDSGSLDRETEAYGWLQDAPDDVKDIVPTFVAHVSMNGEIMGFLLEYVVGRAAYSSSADVQACEKALQQLHSLGIEHGHISRRSFLIRTDSYGHDLKYGRDQDLMAYFWHLDTSAKTNCEKTLQDERGRLSALYQVNR
ncbi:alpha-galactosidase a precursor [Ophiostoma piceae UAMH 11346]|uniref:Alpha-galactosidase a n=1 Tax=Ophiostoma piceae (strain UAMH 11346) TaxID=1262450 RepID=S3C9A8_OPHP1|nr:alpha-galactosidase a precursor [Ophiostoma piceae UAMH 11346]